MDKSVDIALIIKVLLYSFVPTIGINLIIRPFWGGNVETNTGLATFSILFTIRLLPAYLLVVNYLLAKRYYLDQFIVCGLVMMSCVWLSSYFHFINWAGSIGSRTNPDGGTEVIISFERWTGTGVIILGTVVGHYRLSKGKKTSSDGFK